MTNPQPPLAGWASRQGRTRDHNEDHLGTPPQWIDAQVLQNKGMLYVVADGMGGHLAGEEASRRAVSRIFHDYYADLAADIPAALEHAIAGANAELYQLAQGNPAFQGMGTTVVAAVLRGDELFIANIGDSRAYLLRGSGARQITLDHSWVEEQVRQGLLTPEQARVHPSRNVITRCLGMGPAVQVDHFRLKLQPGDRLVLCTDGISNVVSDTELARTVTAQVDPMAAAARVLNLAERNGREDDGTLIVINVPGAEGAGAAPARNPARPAQAPGRRPPVLLLAAVAVLAVLGGVVAWWFWPEQAATAPAATPQALAVNEPTGTPTDSSGATSTPVSLTPTPEATPVPSATPAPPQSPTPTATATPAIEPAPVLISPADGADLGSAQNRLQWSWVRELAPDEHFDVRVWKEGDPHHGIAWAKTSSYLINPRDRETGDYGWSIAVIRDLGNGQWEPVSEESEAWTFKHTQPSAPGPSQSGAATREPPATSQPKGSAQVMMPQGETA